MRDEVANVSVGGAHPTRLQVCFEIITNWRLFMLAKRYMASVKNLSSIMKKIVDGTAPDKFTQSHLQSLGFKSSNDAGVISVLKDLGFLSADGIPTARYHAYRDHTNSKYVMAEALREAYADLFHINEKPTDINRKEIVGKFKATHNVSDAVALAQTATFLALLPLADFDKKTTKRASLDEAKSKKIEMGSVVEHKENVRGDISLRYNIEIHLPPTKDVDVYNAIFKSLKEHLLED